MSSSSESSLFDSPPEPPAHVRRGRAGRGEPRAAGLTAPAAFNPVLAHELAQLTAVAAERLAGAKPAPPTPWLAAGDLFDGSTAVATLFISRGLVVAAFHDLPFPRTGTLEPLRWIPGAVLAGIGSRYAAIRSTLHRRLVELRCDALPLICAGHGSGGALAAVAALDFAVHPEAGAPGAGGLYTFGATVVGDVAFNAALDLHLGAKSHHLARPGDLIAQRVDGRALPLPRAMELPGGARDRRNGRDFHALAVYRDLLDPNRGFDGHALRGASPAAVTAHYRDALDAYRIAWNDVRKCPLDSSDLGGLVILSWDRVHSHVAAACYDDDCAQIAVQRVVVRPGHRLVIESPHGQHVRLFAEELILCPGAVVRILAPSLLHVGALRALAPRIDARELAPPLIDVEGSHGPAGLPGSSSRRGAGGGDGQAGSPAGEGSAGGTGQNGGAAPPVALDVHTISGRFVVRTVGGKGGDGGTGGDGGAGGAGGADAFGNLAAGGAGGNAGQGGNGAAGGEGGTVHIEYQKIDAASSVASSTPSAPGGAGGAGGRPGAGGRGHPRGASGTPGAAGTPGVPGWPGRVVTKQRLETNRSES